MAEAQLQENKRIKIAEANALADVEEAKEIARQRVFRQQAVSRLEEEGNV